MRVCCYSTLINHGVSQCSDILVTGVVCLYPENPALGLGVCAAIFLIMAQIIATVGGYHGCCKSRATPSESKRVIGVVCAVISWIAAGVAFAMYMEGALWNANVERYMDFCKVLDEGIFAGGAVLALFATTLGITSYVVLRGNPAAAASAAPMASEQQQRQPGGAGIATEQPQFLPLQGYGQAPPNYPQYSPPPQGYGQHQQFAPPPAAAQGYGAYPPPAHGYGAHPPNQRFSPPPHQQGHEQV